MWLQARQWLVVRVPISGVACTVGIHKSATCVGPGSSSDHRECTTA